MKRLVATVILAALGCTACGSSLSTSPARQHGAFVGDIPYEERVADRLAFEAQTWSRLEMASLRP